MSPMNKKLLLPLAFFAWLVASCSPDTRTTLMSVVNQDIRVDLTATADWEAADGHIEVISIPSNEVVKTILFAKADDYVDDISDKVTHLGAKGNTIVVCLRYAELAQKGEVYVSPAGVVVEIVEDDGAVKVCNQKAPN